MVRICRRAILGEMPWNLTELSTARTARFAGFRPVVQTDIVPSSVTQRNIAGDVVPGTRNADEGFQTMPLGEAVFGQLLPCPAFGGQGSRQELRCSED